eukprot:3453421-Amphidinium_carterae.1
MISFKSARNNGSAIGNPLVPNCVMHAITCVVMARHISETLAARQGSCFRASPYAETSLGTMR